MQLNIKNNKDGSKTYSFDGFEEVIFFVLLLAAILSLYKSCSYEMEMDYQKEKIILEQKQKEVKS